MKLLLWCASAVQVLLAIGVFRRMARTSGGETISRERARSVAADNVSIVVPVLNEARRLEPCLASLRAQHAEVREVVVVDGGSTDGTQDIVRAAALADSRVRFVDASPLPPGVNGKAYGLAAGIAAASQDSAWVLVVDADVRMRPDAVHAIVAHAERRELKVLSLATTQKIDGPLLGLLHPSMLTTLVYRFGIPGHAVTDPADVQANGQCFLIDRDLLASAGGFEGVQHTIAEDVALARIIAATGTPVGFFMSDELVDVEMHSDARDAWDNWPRSLPLLERQDAIQSYLRLAQCVFVQALPLPMLVVTTAFFGWKNLLTQIQLGLVFARLGVLVGTRSAYPNRPWSYWLSPLADLPVTIEIIRRSR